MSGLTPFILWGIVLACWLVLFMGARSRARLLNALAEKRAGSVRRRFSFMTMMPEVFECVCEGRVGSKSCRFRVNYELPKWGSSSGTTLGVEGRFSLQEGEYLPADFRAGRKFVLCGVDFTERYSSLARSFPPHVVPSVAWGKEGIRCRVASLLGMQHELAAERCLLFLCELAAVSEGA